MCGRVGMHSWGAHDRGTCVVGGHAWQGGVHGRGCISGGVCGRGACMVGGMHGMCVPLVDTMRYGQ